ncbi:MAG: MoaD/ThiS family protein [Candidatus Anstonellaceae archaeon]
MKLIVDGKEVEKPPSAKTVAQLMQMLGLSKEEVLVKVNGKLVPDGHAISPKDEVKIIKVIYGG